MRIATVALFGVLSVAGGCSSTGPDNKVELDQVPTSINLGGQSVELSAYAWRNFMPAVPPDGPPLIVVVSLPDHLTGVDVDRLWVSFEDEVWETGIEHVSGTNDWRADGGPKWEPGVLVAVVARLRDQRRNRFYVRATEVRVEAPQ